LILVGIISDTHSRYRDKGTKNLGLPIVVLESLKACNLIVHAGDLGNSRELIALLSGIAPLIVVKGNHDKRTKGKIPFKVMKKINGWQVGVVHGHGDNVRHNPLKITKFFREPLDILVFGHTHWPMVYADRDLVLLNPGSTSSTAYTPFSSFMIMAVEKDQIDVVVNILDREQTFIEQSRRFIFFKK